MKLPLEEAINLLLQNTPVPEASTPVPLLDSLGRIVSQDCLSRFDQPPFDRSPLDGYAARHEDLADAGTETPAILTVTQKVYAGDPAEKTIGAGEAAVVQTGAPLPPGATCVAALEDTDRGEERVKIYISLKKHQNYVFRGEDLRAGQLIAARGARLNSSHIGVLAGQGISELQVYPRPKAAMLSTGNELLPLPTPATRQPAHLKKNLLPPGMIYESNNWVLAARAIELGGEAHVAGRVRDNPEQIAAALENLLEDHDVVVTSGGVSAGERDYMSKALKLLGAETLFHGLRYKPGGITLAALKDGKLILCLPGNPFAAFMSFELLARPALEKLAGLEDHSPRRLGAVLRGDFSKPSPDRRFVRGRLAGGEVFVEKHGHAAGSLSLLSRSNCLIDIPAGSPPLPDGTTVEVIPSWR